MTVAGRSRRGVRIPHPRHWEALRTLVDSFTHPLSHTGERLLLLMTRSPASIGTGRLLWLAA